MVWSAQFNGTHESPNENVGREEEQYLAEQLAGVADELTERGHVGVAASFTGEHVGQVNLLEALPWQEQPADGEQPPPGYAHPVGNGGSGQSEGEQPPPQ